MTVQSENPPDFQTNRYNFRFLASFFVLLFLHNFPLSRTHGLLLLIQNAITSMEIPATNIIIYISIRDLSYICTINLYNKYHYHQYKFSNLKHSQIDWFSACRSPFPPLFSARTQTLLLLTASAPANSFSLFSTIFMNIFFIHHCTYLWSAKYFIPELYRLGFDKGCFSWDRVCVCLLLMLLPLLCTIGRCHRLCISIGQWR